MIVSRLRNVLLKAGVALSLAFLVWLYARSRHQETIDDVLIPVHIALATGDQAHHDLEITGGSRVPASFSGPVSRIRELRALLQRGDVQINCVVAVSEEKQNEPSYRDTVRVEPGDVPAPPGVTTYLVEGRNCVPVTVHRLVERRLP